MSCGSASHGRRGRLLAALAVALVLAMALAGCTQGDDRGEGAGDRGDEGFPPPLSDDEMAGLTPLWYPGLVFRYAVEHHPTAEEGALDFVVLDGPGAAFTLDPVDEENPDDLLAWALFWGFPVGAVADEDFEPRGQEGPLDWFSFPLRDGDAWQGSGPDGVPVLFRASALRVALPGGESVPGFLVRGEQNGTTVMEYTYSSKAGWFVSLWWDATGDGEPEVSMELVEVSLRRELADRPHREPVRVFDRWVHGAPTALTGLPGGPLPVVEQTFQVSDPEADMFVVVRFVGDGGLYQVNVTFDDADGGREWTWLHTGAQPATWRNATTLVPGAEEGTLSVLVAAPGRAHVAAIQLGPYSQKD